MSLRMKRIKGAKCGNSLAGGAQRTRESRGLAMAVSNWVVLQSSVFKKMKL